MFSLAWDVKELDDLNEKGRCIIRQCAVLRDRQLDDNYDAIANNLARQLADLREEVLLFAKRVIRYRRVAATHVLIVMISPEERKSKPYALTVQCIAYKSIKDSEIRVICNNVTKEMVTRGMSVAGAKILNNCMQEFQFHFIQVLSLTVSGTPCVLRGTPDLSLYLKFALVQERNTGTLPSKL